MQLAPADIVDPSRFDDTRRQQVDIIAASVSSGDSNTVATFGAGPQRKLSGFLDQLLGATRADDIGVAGALVTELATDIKALDLPAIKREAEGRPGLLARLPVVGRYYSAFRRFRALHEQVTAHLAAIEQRAETHLGKLKASNAGLDRLLDATEANLRELEVWVAGGQKALLRMRQAFGQEHAALVGVRDPVRLAKLRDMAEQIDAFETRLVRMHVAFTRGILAIPQIRMAQQAGADRDPEHAGHDPVRPAGSESGDRAGGGAASDQPGFGCDGGAAADCAGAAGDRGGGAGPGLYGGEADAGGHGGGCGDADAGNGQDAGDDREGAADRP